MIKVLIVDDSLFMRKNLESMLEELGYRVVGFAKDGHESISAYETLKPDVVLMDIDMPNMNGLQALSVLKRRFTDIKVIMATAKGSSKVVKAALRAGAKNYILKPISPTTLDDAIKKIFPKAKIISPQNPPEEKEDRPEDFFDLD